MKAADFRRAPPPPDLAPPPPPPTREEGPDFEANGVVFDAGHWPETPTKIFTTKKRWRAIDVYVELKTDANTVLPAMKDGILSVFVFAVVQVGQVATRVLVASGRMVDPPVTTGAGAAVVVSPKWVCAARADAQVYEVVVQLGAGTGNPAVPVQITAVASDQAVSPPPLLGAIQFAGNALINKTGIIVNAGLVPPPLFPRPELVGVMAVNAVAAARYLMLFDGLPANGDIPMLTWPMGATIGAGIVDMLVRYRAERGIALRVSTTPAVLTADLVSDSRIGTYIR